MKLKLFTTLFALTAVLTPHNGYSQFTDTLTREVNYRLLQGAEAREQIRVYQKLTRHDSLTIVHLKSELNETYYELDSVHETNNKKSIYIMALSVYSAMLTVILMMQ